MRNGSTIEFKRYDEGRSSVIERIREWWGWSGGRSKKSPEAAVERRLARLEKAVHPTPKEGYGGMMDRAIMSGLLGYEYHEPTAIERIAALEDKLTRLYAHLNLEATTLPEKKVVRRKRK